MSILQQQSIVLKRSARTQQLPLVDLNSQTARLTVSIARPRTGVPRAWTIDDRLRVTLLIELDGIVYRCDGQATGGLRLGRFGEEQDYLLSYEIPHGFFGARSGSPMRLGERRVSIYRAALEVEALEGTCTTDITLSDVVAPDDGPVFRSSVAYDNASSAYSGTGTGTVGWSHTASGSNRAACIGQFGYLGGSATSATYASNAATVLIFQEGDFNEFLALHYLKEASVPTGAQTVTATLTGGGSVDHGGSVVTLTGVEQTTPVGTPVSTFAASGTTPSVTVASVVAGGMCVDFIGAYCDTTSAAVGANQTERTGNRTVGDFEVAMSTQSSADGGVMSWTKPSNWEYQLAAVEFKPAAAGGGGGFRSRLAGGFVMH